MTSHETTSTSALPFITNALAALAIGVLQLGVAISLAALIFSGPLGEGAGRAAAGFMLGTAIVSALVGWRTSMTVVIAGAQDTAAIVIAAVAASIATNPSVAPDERVSTVVVMIAICALITGITFWAVGRYGLSSFVRYLPYPVISGFTAGTGWLLFRGGVEVMNRDEITLSTFSDLFSWTSFKFLLPGLVLAVLMLVVVSTRLPNILVSVGVLSGAVVFHLIARSRTSLETLENQGWLIGPFDDSGKWSPVGPSDFQQTDWSALVDNALPIIAVVVVSVVGVLLNLIGLEPGDDSAIDLNRELHSAGAANVLLAAGGGIVGYHLIGDSVLGRQLGARGRAVPVMIAALAMAAFAAGPDLIALVPRAVAGGVLAGLGVNLLHTWFSSIRTQTNRADAYLSAVILVTIAVLGVLPGVTAGVLIAAGIFVVRYSRIDPVRHHMAAAGRSNVDRHPHQRHQLATAVPSIVAFELQGYLFFGSIAKLRDQIITQVSPSQTSVPCAFVVLDFAHVTGIDSTAASGLDALSDQLAELQIMTTWSGIRPVIGQELSSSSANQHLDLDHAIAWCEDQMLSSMGSVADDATISGLDRSAFASHLGTRQLTQGETLITAGEIDLHLYFVESGELSAWISSQDGRSVRIRRVLPGSVLGEIGFCTGSARTATVIADSDAVVLVLARQRFDELAGDAPETAMAIQQHLLRLMGDRVASTSSMVRDLLR